LRRRAVGHRGLRRTAPVPHSDVPWLPTAVRRAFAGPPPTPGVCGCEPVCPPRTPTHAGMWNTPALDLFKQPAPAAGLHRSPPSDSYVSPCRTSCASCELTQASQAIASKGARPGWPPMGRRVRVRVELPSIHFPTSERATVIRSPAEPGILTCGSARQEPHAAGRLWTGSRRPISRRVRFGRVSASKRPSRSAATAARPAARLVRVRLRRRVGVGPAGRQHEVGTAPVARRPAGAGTNQHQRHRRARTARLSAAPLRPVSEATRHRAQQ
jgi:hypothetical protein